MNKVEMLETIYPNHDKVFSFDTALPVISVDNIMKECYPDLKPFTPEYSEKRIAIYESVYAYGKYPDSSQGFIPLTKAARKIFDDFAYKTGYSIVFTPVIDGYIDQFNKQLQQEFKELQKLDIDFEFEQYKESREYGSSFETIKKMWETTQPA